jgi:hypothetical protein
MENKAVYLEAFWFRSNAVGGRNTTVRECVKIKHTP